MHDHPDDRTIVLEYNRFTVDAVRINDPGECGADKLLDFELEGALASRALERLSSWSSSGATGRRTISA